MRRILIIEDDKDIADVEKDYLELSGFAVTIENNGLNGLKRAQSEAFDLIIVDLMLPGVDGFSICQKIRETKETPIIMVSARRDDMVKTRGFEVGLDDFIEKPFSAQELVARVKGRLSRYERLTGKQSGETILSDRGLILDLESRRSFLNDEEIVLTNKEFDLTSFFMQNPNKVFSRESLFEKLWDMSAEGDIQTVTVHIKRIREKIEFEPTKPERIQTVWGIGYKYVK